MKTINLVLPGDVGSLTVQPDRIVGVRPDDLRRGKACYVYLGGEPIRVQHCYEDAMALIGWPLPEGHVAPAPKEPPATPAQAGPAKGDAGQKQDVTKKRPIGATAPEGSVLVAKDDGVNL